MFNPYNFISISPTQPRIKLPVTDKDGVSLYAGDIIAEGTLGEDIWAGAGKIIRRPIGIVYASSNLTKKRFDEDRLFGVIEILAGSALINKDIVEDKHYPISDIYNKDGQQLFTFHLSNEYNQYMAWDDCELVGNVFDLEKVFDDYYKIQ